MCQRNPEAAETDTFANTEKLGYRPQIYEPHVIGRIGGDGCEVRARDRTVGTRAMFRHATDWVKAISSRGKKRHGDKGAVIERYSRPNLLQSHTIRNTNQDEVEIYIPHSARAREKRTAILEKPITDKQFFILLDRGYSREMLRGMSCAEAREIISGIAKAENWYGTATHEKKQKPQKPARKKSKSNKPGKKARQRELIQQALEIAQHTCQRCSSNKNVRAFSIAGIPQKAVLCTPCQQLVSQAAFMEFTPEYQRIIEGSA